GAPPHLHSFPTRRSSDLVTVVARRIEQDVLGHYADPETPPSEVCRFESLNQPTTCSAKPQRSGLYELTAEVIDASGRASRTTTQDRKSTRLNSSHVKISY